MFHAKNYLNRPMFHRVIPKITVAHFLRHGVFRQQQEKQRSHNVGVFSCLSR